MTETNAALVGSREIVITRVFNAPRELVFKVWTEPEHLAKWWGPRGFTNTIHSIDVTPGGVWQFDMHGPDGTKFPNRIVYNEVVKPERITYSHGGDDEEGQFQVTVTFEEQGDKTALTMRTLFRSEAERDYVVKEFGAIEGGKSTLERLAEHLDQM